MYVVFVGALLVLFAQFGVFLFRLITDNKIAIDTTTLIALIASPLPLMVGAYMIISQVWLFYGAILIAFASLSMNLILLLWSKSLSSKKIREHNLHHTVSIMIYGASFSSLLLLV